MKNRITTFLFCLLGTSLIAQIPTNGLISSYTFNLGNANDETGSNNGTVFGATLTEDRFGNENKAYVLDGVNDYIDFGDVPGFQMGKNDFSISFWMNYDTDQLSQVIGKRGGSSNNYEQYNILIGSNLSVVPTTSSSVNYFLRSNGLNATESAGDLKGSWRHIVLVFDYDGVKSLYVDNVLNSSSSTTFTGDFNAVGSSLIVGFFDQSSGYYYDGKIDDIYIYNRVLSEADITALYEAEDPTLSVKEFEKGPLSVYPNPTNNVLKINSNKVLGAIITNAQGAFIRSIEIKEETTIDVSNYAQGVYFIRTEEGQTVKFVKQ
jgi:hypothetical protein